MTDQTHPSFSLPTLGNCLSRGLRKTQVLAGLVALVGLGACQSDYNQVYDLPEKNWKVNIPLHFPLTQSYQSADWSDKEVRILVKSNEDYRFCNLYLQAQLTDSAGQTVYFSKLKEIMLNDPTTGEPLGSGIMGSNEVNGRLFNWKETHLPDSIQGKNLKLTLRQWMRDSSVIGIESVGLRIGQAAQ